MGQGAKPNHINGLTLQQRLFCQILVTQAPFFNASEASRRAGYCDNTTTGNRLMNNPRIKEYVTQLREETAIRNNIILDDIINQYANKAFFDIRELYDEEGKLKDVKDFSVRAAANVIGIEVEEIWEGFGKDKMQIGELKKVKISDQSVIALDRLRECLGWKEKQKRVIRDAEGKIVQTEETESESIEDKVIFEDHSGKVEDV